MALLLVIFVILPIAELYVIIQVGHAIGVFDTIGLLLLVSLVGSWLVKREGLAVWRRFNEQVQAGMAPGNEIADGVMVLLAGALLISPGFVTDVFGVLLLLPPVRAVVRALLVRRTANRIRRF